MAEPIVFYSSPMSRGRIVHWMLEEVGAPYRFERIDLERNEQKSPKFLAINPMGKVPAIAHRGIVVTETAAILAYLADAFPQANLAPPPTDPARGPYFRWLFFGAGCLEPAIIDRMFERPPPARTAALGYGSYADTLAVLEQAVTPGPYLLGERFSAADVYLAAQIGWALGMKALEPRPAILRYSERCTARPAFQRFNAASPMPNA
jgi:glutathione S-transferase